jgi:8-oxo-dGTP pyrophosphatase MutT (NUDIX family)
VLVAILEHGGEECVLLTKRPDTLGRYAGQVSFPGGEWDEADADLSDTAIREAGEEVGIGPERITLLAELPWRSTTIGHRVKPFLARVAPGPLEPHPAEVERILYLPVSVLKSDPFRLRTWTDPQGNERTTWSFTFEGLEIWGLTARILREHFAGGRDDRRA